MGVIQSAVNSGIGAVTGAATSSKLKNIIKGAGKEPSEELLNKSYKLAEQQRLNAQIKQADSMYNDIKSKIYSYKDNGKDRVEDVFSNILTTYPVGYRRLSPEAQQHLNNKIEKELKGQSIKYAEYIMGKRKNAVGDIKNSAQYIANKIKG